MFTPRDTYIGFPLNDFELFCVDLHVFIVCVENNNTIESTAITN